MTKVFGKDSKVWTDYVRRFDRSIGIKLFGSWRKAILARKNGDDFHSYFAVVERGSKTGRLHIHVVHMMKCLPSGCFDPNSGRAVPNLREVSKLKVFWEYGFSSPVAVRFNNADAYAKLYWRWPVKMLASGIFDPLPCKEPEALVQYIGKYITKEYEKALDKEFVRWRIRMSRKMGMIQLMKVVKKANLRQLRLMIKTPSQEMVKFLGKRIQRRLLKRLAMKEYLMRFIS